MICQDFSNILETEAGAPTCFEQIHVKCWPSSNGRSSPIQCRLAAGGTPGPQRPGKILVADATFDVHRGETLAIVGPSGSGKTSLLRLLNRLDEPTSGTEFLDGADYRQLAPPDLRRRVGMVMQRPYLFPGTVAENLRFGPRQRGEEMPDDQVDKLLAGVGLVGYLCETSPTFPVAKRSGFVCPHAGKRTGGAAAR